MEHIIEINGLNKSFGDVKAVRDLSFHVQKGELFAFLGVNGAGKSTTISIMCGQLRKDSGSVVICGENIEHGLDKITRKLGVVFQNSVLDKSLSVRDNLRSRAALYGITGKEFKSRLSELAAMLDFETILDRTVGKLSGGQRRRVDIARALLHKPEILILDEPVDGLDPVMRRQVWRELMHDVSENGTTVLISSHNLRELEDVCDHVGIMNRGKIMIERTLSDLQEGIVKMQLALPDGGTLPDGLDILHKTSTGRLQTIILHGASAELEEKLSPCKPLFMDFVPLTLEEIFIYELGGADYEVKDIVL